MKWGTSDKQKIKESLIKREIITNLDQMEEAFSGVSFFQRKN